MSRRYKPNQNKPIQPANNGSPSRTNQNSVAITHQEAHFYKGPLPPAEEIERYNNIIPDGANRIMVMAENQAQHRMECERKVIDNDIRNSRLGLILGFILQFSGVLGGIIIAVTQSMWKGILMTVGIIVLGVLNFQITKRARDQELNRKEKPGNNSNQ